MRHTTGIQLVCLIILSSIILLLASCSEETKVSNSEIFEISDLGEYYFPEDKVYTEPVEFTYMLGSIFYEVDDIELINDFAKMMRNCTYTKIDASSPEYEAYRTGEYKRNSGNYYELTWMAHFGWVHTSGEIIIPGPQDADGNPLVYKISGLDKELFDRFFNYGIDKFNKEHDISK